MAMSRKSAAAVLSASELVLFEESFAPALAMLGNAAIKSRIARARRLRDKYRDLAGKQARVIKGVERSRRRRPATSTRNAVTQQKLFDEALGRFEGRLARLERNAAAQAARENLKAALAHKASPSMAGARKGAAGKPASRKSAVPTPSKKKQSFPNLQTMKGAARANHARAQAKRDSRRG